MTRRPRNYQAGEIYHLIQRGNNQAFVFAGKEDKIVFLKLLGSALRRFPCSLLYYVLMDNHYHLVVRQQDISISLLMQRLNWSYSSFINEKYDRTGTIFGQRYVAYHVFDRRYFLVLLRYLAYNPVKAKLVSEPGQYRWSAHYDIMYRSMTPIAEKQLLQFFAQDPLMARHLYRQYITGNPQEILQINSLQELIQQRRQEKLAFLYLQTINETGQKKHMSVSNQDMPVVSQKLPARHLQRFLHQARQQGFSMNEIAWLLQCSKSKISRIMAGK